MLERQDRPQTFSGNRASQMTEEIGGLIRLAHYIDATSYLEIGARHGDTFHMMLSQFPQGSLGLAVDMPGGLWGISSSMQSLERALLDLQKNGKPGAACTFGDSQTDEVAARVNSWRRHHVGPRPFDLALIDGDHRLPGVTRDWELYSPMCRFVAFHDIVGTGQFERAQGNAVEVPILWEQLKAQAPDACREFVAAKSTMGIGVVDTSKFYDAATLDKFQEALAWKERA